MLYFVIALVATLTLGWLDYRFFAQYRYSVSRHCTANTTVILILAFMFWQIHPWLTLQFVILAWSGVGYMFEYVLDALRKLMEKHKPYFELFELELMGGHVVWLWWTPAGIVSQKYFAGLPTSGPRLLAQAGIGLVLAILAATVRV